MSDGENTGEIGSFPDLHTGVVLKVLSMPEAPPTITADGHKEAHEVDLDDLRIDELRVGDLVAVRLGAKDGKMISLHKAAGAKDAGRRSNEARARVRSVDKNRLTLEVTSGTST